MINKGKSRAKPFCPKNFVLFQRFQAETSRKKIQESIVLKKKINVPD
jgi:hypothetical protein